MTPQQRKALDFIERFYGERRYSPSLQEVADHLGLCSKSGAHRLVKGLIRSGNLVQTFAGRRNIVPGCFHLSELTTEALRAELQRREAPHG